jgi:hypothetical protein
MDGTGLLWVNNFILSPFQWSTVGSWNNAQCWDSFIYDNSSIYAYGYRPGIDGAGDCSVIAYGGMLFLYSSQLGPVSGSSVDSAPSFDFSTNTPSMAVDPGGNIFVADAGNNAIKEVLASSNFTIDRTVGSGFNNPAGVASDALGNIYVSDAGNNALKEMTAASGYTQILTIATFDPKVLTLGNLTVDGPGNIYIANVNPSDLIAGVLNQATFETNQLVKLDFSDAPALTFPTQTQIGTTDTTDGTLTATVKNSGNAPLTISGLTVSNVNFRIDADATTCSASAPLAAGDSCTVGVIFTPTTTGALIGTLTLTDNALNNTSATQNFALSGAGYLTPATTTPTVAVTPTSGSITTAQSDQVTVKVSGASGSPTPTGAVVLSSGNYASPTVLLSGGSASFTVPAGMLAVGSDTLIAIYTPDTASSTIYGAAAGTGSVAVTAVSKTTPTVTVTPSIASITTAQSLPVMIGLSGGNCQGRSKSRPLGRSKREPVEDREGVFRGRRGAGA